MRNITLKTTVSTSIVKSGLSTLHATPKTERRYFILKSFETRFLSSGIKRLKSEKKDLLFVVKLLKTYPLLFDIIIYHRLYHLCIYNARKIVNNKIGDFMISTVMRTIILYITVTLAIRLMGKRQIGDMQPNELVITLLISEIAAIPLQDTDQPMFIGLAAIFVLVFLEIVISILAMKSFSVRRLLNGQSVVIIKNGVIDQHAMRNVRMTVIDLIEQLRGQNVFNIEDVAFAVLEVNGNLSVLLKKDAQTISVKDMDLQLADDKLPLPVISDGKIIYESLRSLEVSRQKLDKILKHKCASYKDVFLMTLDRDGNHTIIKKGDV